nr:integrase, catalytic region, zinc finger, CCHC-type, peptidase aspartic, catalytic [Tanacetum cinerariifolium]
VSVTPTVVTHYVVTPTVEKTNDGFQTVSKKKKKGRSKSTNGGQVGGHLVKQTVRYELKASTSVPKKGATNLGNASKSSSMLKNQPLKATAPSTKEGNITMSNSYAALDDESDEDVKNVYDESANLLHSSNTGGSSSTFTAAVDFFKARITKARFEIIAKEDKEHIVEKKIDVILPLHGEFASPEVKGSLDANEDIGVDEVSSVIDGVFNIGESNVKSIEVRSKFDEFLKNKTSLEEVVVEVTCPESTIQTLPSFEEYAPAVTYPKEEEKTIGTPIELRFALAFWFCDLVLRFAFWFCVLLIEDIFCVLPREDFARKENGVNILKSIDEGPFQMGTVREPLAEGTERAHHLGPERPRVYSNLSPKEKDRNIKMTMSKMQLNSKFVNNMLPEWGRFVIAVKLNRGLRDSNYDQLNQATVQDGRVVVQNVQGRHSRGQGTNPRGGGAALYGGVQNIVGNANPGQARQVKCYNCNGIGHIARNCTQPKRPQNSDYYKDKMLLMQAQENGVALDEEQLLFVAGGQDTTIDEDVDEQPVQDLALNVDNVFQADDCDAFDSDVDEAPTAQTMFMANLSSTDPVNDEAGPSYNSDNLSKVQDHDHYQDIVCAHHEEHAMHDNVQLNHVVDSHADYTSDSNMILYDQYVKDNAMSVVHNNQVQPALYNGHEIIKDNHVPAVVHNTEDTLEIAEIIGRKMNDKMKDPECVTHKVKIAPHDYSNENFLATFIPQKQLTPEQIFWSQDLTMMKSKAFREQTTVSRQIKALTVYPSNTPTTLVPRVLPTKSQIKIHIFTLIQIFLEFDKTFKKRITSTGLTEGERGFEQTKACYLKEVIPFFQTLKKNFEGIQKALTKEIKEIKDVFEELEAEVAQNVVDRKHDEMERKNLIIANDNLIAECLTKEVFFVVTNYKLNVARFTEMHVANTIVEKRCLELEVELSNLRDKSHNDNHDELVNRFSNLEVNRLNVQLKYQNLKDSLGNNPPTSDKDTPDFDSVFVIGKMQASLQGKDNVIRKLKKQISHLQETRSDTDRTLKVRAVDSQITQLTKKVTVFQAQNDSFRAENDKIKQHYRELYDSIKITRAKHIEQVTALTTENVNLKAQILDTVNSVNVESIVPRLRNNREAHLDYLRHLKESVETIRDTVKEAKVDRSRLMNFVKKFIGTVRFGNDHFGAIMGYGDYVIGDSVISRVYHVEGLGHNLFFVRQFCDYDLEVAFRKHSCYVRDTDGVKLIKGSRGSNLYTISVEYMMKYSPI